MQSKNTITIWHNPRCSKSREVLQVLQTKGIDADVIKYLENSPNVQEITNLLKMLKIPARELMRTKEAIYKELKLKEEHDESKLIQAMAENPKLIERPILFKDGEAIIGRPASRIEQWLS